jgi:hypothetical protein
MHHSCKLLVLILMGVMGVCGGRPDERQQQH